MAVNYRHGDVVVLLDRVARTALLSSEDFAAQAAGHLKQLIFMSKILYPKRERESVRLIAR